MYRSNDITIFEDLFESVSFSTNVINLLDDDTFELVAEISKTIEINQNIEDVAEITNEGADTESGGNAFLLSLVAYIQNGSRIFLCHKVKTWQDYLNANQQKNGNHLTCADLRDFFVKRMLPKIFEFEMPETFKKKFKILKLNSNFERLDDGFELKTTRNDYNMPLTYDVDYGIMEANEFDNDEERRRRELEENEEEQNLSLVMEEVAEEEDFVMEYRKSDPLPPHLFVITGAGAEPSMAKPRSPPRTSVTNRALLSAVVSKDYELFYHAMIETKEILQRMRKSRVLFQKNGRTSIILDVKVLQQKVKTMTELHRCVANLMNKRF